jgi:hypothetical protein
VDPCGKLEFTATTHVNPLQPDGEDLLVLYLGDRRTVDPMVAGSGADPVPGVNPYWDRVGVTVTDPDGFRIVLVADDWAVCRRGDAGRQLRCGRLLFSRPVLSSPLSRTT